MSLPIDPTPRPSTVALISSTCRCPGSRLGFRAAMLGLVLAVTVMGAAGAQNPATEAPSTVAEGLAALQGGDAADAVEILRRATAKEPESGPAWFHLGQALDAAEAREEAMEVFLKAAPMLPPHVAVASRAGALLGAARAAARLDRKEAALRLLTELKSKQLTDLTNLDNDPGFASLLEDPRFMALQPTAEELADPFVEPVKVLWELRGEAAGDNFGWIARRYGDVDGDRVDDVVTSAPRKMIGEDAAAGRVYAYSGKTGALLWSRDGKAGWRLGRGVEAAGDVNGDGIPDVVASAPGGDRVFVYHGVSGATILELEASQAGEAFGQHVKGIGDIDGDGHGDLLVGAPAHDPAESLADAGRLAVYSGADGTILWEEPGSQAGARFGETVTGGFDGRHLVWVGGAPGASQVVVVKAERPQPKRPQSKGADSETVQAVAPVSREVLRGEISAASYGGMFMSLVGDVDGDGVLDLYVSDWQDGAAGVAAGRIYVYSGADSRRLLTRSGEAAGDGFGIGSAEAGDVNGDGHDDLVVGAWRHASAAPGAGKVYVISGRSGATLRTITSKVPGETFGFDAQGLGDVDGDGKIDLLLTSAWSRVQGARAGRIFLLAGE